MNPVWRYERTLSFPIPIERAWALFTSPKETSAWLLPLSENAEGKQETTVEGQRPIEFEIKVIDKPKLLHTAMKGGNMPAWTEMIATFSAESGTTRVEVVHLEFGDAERWTIFGT